MTAFPASLAAAVLLAALRAQVAPPAFVEVELPGGPVYVQQRIEIVLRVGTDAGFFAAQGIPLFQQRLDRPFQVVVPWLEPSAGRDVVLREGPADGPRVVVGGRAVRWHAAGSRQRDGRTWELLELRCHWIPRLAGAQEVEPVALHYAFATRFQEHLLRGREPSDRQEASVSCAAARFEVRELPAAGRPERFDGAVGEFTVRAAAPVAAVPLGGSFTLEVAIEGDGDLAGLPAMAWPELPGFVVQGLVERRAPAARLFAFDVLAVRGGATEVPPVSFAFFSPRAGRYVTQWTAPVPLAVGPAAGILPARVAALVDADRRAVAGAAGWPAGRWLLPAAGVGIAIVVCVLLRRRARGNGRQRAFAALAAALGGGADVEAFASFCASCAGGGPAAGFDAVLGRCAERGAPPALLARVRTLHERLDAARYGGTKPQRDEVLGVARELLQAVR